jgi:hypothetical protein
MYDTDLAAWDRAVFATARTTVTISDAICAAHFRGELEPSWRGVLTLAECEKSAVEPDEDELQACSERFRVDRDLITAEETERWLGERGLTLEDFSIFLVRQCRRDTSITNTEVRERVDYAFAPLAPRDVLRVDLLFSGDFDRLATQLAWRIAAREATDRAVSEDSVEIERARFKERSGVSDTALPAWLAGLGCDWLWFNEMLELEAVFRWQSEALLAPRSLERMLQSLRVPLTRFELELIELDSHDVAREAFQCVSRDGESMEEVAKNARFPFRHINVLYEDLPNDLQQKLLSAMPGEVLDPILRGNGFQLCRLLRKVESDLADEEVRSRVEWEIVDRHFSELAGRFVRWILPPASIA